MDKSTALKASIAAAILLAGFATYKTLQFNAAKKQLATCERFAVGDPSNTQRI